MDDDFNIHCFLCWSVPFVIEMRDFTTPSADNQFMLFYPPRPVIVSRRFKAIQKILKSGR